MRNLYSKPAPTFFHLKVSKVKAEALTRKAEVAPDCAKHGNVKAEVPTVCAKYGNVKAEVPTECAKHGNVKAEVLTLKAEIATDCAKSENVNPGAIFFDRY